MKEVKRDKVNKKRMKGNEKEWKKLKSKEAGKREKGTRKEKRWWWEIKERRRNNNEKRWLWGTKERRREWCETKERRGKKW